MAFIKLNSHFLPLWESVLIAQISKYCTFSAIFVSSKMMILIKWTGSVGGSAAALWHATKDLATHHHGFLSETHPFFLLLLFGWFSLSICLSLSPSFCVCVCVYVICVHVFMHMCLCIYEKGDDDKKLLHSHPLLWFALKTYCLLV